MLRAVLLITAAFASPAVDETWVGDVDLAGWRRAGACAVEGACWDARDVAALLDGDARSVAEASDDAPGRWTLRLTEPARVRRITVDVADGPVDVALTVVEPDGSRFAAGRVAATSDAPATFELRDVDVAELAFDATRGDGARLRVRDVSLVAQHTITGVELVGVPEALPEGGSFPIAVRGRDTRGGRPDLTSSTQLRVAPLRALAVRDGRAVARVGGPVTVSVHLGALDAAAASLLVEPLDAAPGAPQVEALPGQVAVSTTAAPPFEVLRRRAGDTETRVVGRSLSSRWVDGSAEVGAAYQYAVRRVDAFGNAMSATSPETRARVPRRADGATASVRVLPVLVTYAPADVGVSDDDVAAALEAARAFVFRHTTGVLCLEIDVLRLDGRTPDVAGPSMYDVEERLRAAGAPDGRHAFVFAIVPGATTGYSGFTLLGGVAGGFGPPRGVAPVAPPQLGPLPMLTWTLLHELNHALELSLGPAVGLDDLPTHHLADDFAASRLGTRTGRAFDAGDGWDGLARVLAAFPDWSRLPAPPLRAELVVDADADGLPDDAPHLPLDERRIGSDPARADSDGDGLDDLSECCAGLYGGSDPLVADSDGDGRPDGEDRLPLCAVTPSIPFGSEPQPIAEGDGLSLAASWTADALHLAITTDGPHSVYLDLDGSGALGRWESDVRVAGASDVWAGPARLALRAHGEPRGVFVGRRPVGAATLEATSDDGRTTLRVILPASLGPGAPDVFAPDDAPRADGLRLAPGTVLGLAVTARPTADADPAPFEPFPPGAAWTSLFEPWRLVDVVLADG